MKTVLKHAIYNALFIFLIAIVALIIAANIFNNETAAQWGALAILPLTFWGFILALVVNAAVSINAKLKNNKIIVYSPTLLYGMWVVFGFFTY